MIYKIHILLDIVGSSTYACKFDYIRYLANFGCYKTMVLHIMFIYDIQKVVPCFALWFYLVVCLLNLSFLNSEVFHFNSHVGLANDKDKTRVEQPGLQHTPTRGCRQKAKGIHTSYKQQVSVRAIGLLTGTLLAATDPKREGNGNREATYGPVEEKAGKSLLVSTISI